MVARENMPAAPRPPAIVAFRLTIGAVLLVGFIAASIAYREGRQAERERAEAEFVHRATLRFSLTKEVFNRYEDSLFGLSSPFMLDSTISEAAFARVAARMKDRVEGVQAFEWVPYVPHENRAAVEALMQRNQPPQDGYIADVSGDLGPRRAPERPFYYPVVYIYPFQGNEAALGFDLARGPTADFLAQARTTGHMTVTHQVRLVQETANQTGVVAILPVFRAPRPAQAAGVPVAETPDSFTGFLQCVFRVRDLFEATFKSQPPTVVDSLFVDGSENDASRRVLYFRPAGEISTRPAPSEAEFRRGMNREFKLQFGQRDWRVVYRPDPKWLETHYTAMPLLRFCGILVLAGLSAGVVHLSRRRTESIHREVEDRTAELAESRRQLAGLLHALPGMAYRCTYDEQLTVRFLSEGSRELTGWTPEEFIERKMHFRDCIHPDDLGRVREATREALQNRTDVEVEYRIRTKSGDEKWVLSRGRGVYAADGVLDSFEGLAIDITAQKNAEAARLSLERKLLEGQKLESLGLLAGGIAHDFNNLLSSILGNASMVRLSLPAGSSSEAQLRAIEAASLRAAELCRQMLAYAGKGRFVVEPVDLTVLTEDLLPLLRISIAHQATLKLNLVRSLPPAMADATQIRQIVMNLVLNAADAIADRGGEITLTTGTMHADSEYLTGCVAGAALTRGDFVFIEVRDTGAGMTAEIKARIFDPFFTTKFAGRGLGLAAVLGIVRGHHGALRVDSAPNVGSSFRLLLPPARLAPPAPKAVEIAVPERWRHAGRVLVVEDEEQVRIVLMEMLKTFGLVPTPAEHGQAGLAAFRQNPESFDLVVLDMLMPVMNGEQTLEALRLIKPDVRVLLVSGYSETDVTSRLGAGRPLAFLPKPFTRDALEKKLRSLLG